MQSYSSERFVPDGIWSRLMEVRREDPNRSHQLAKSRVGREGLSADGKLNRALSPTIA